MENWIVGTIAVLVILFLIGKRAKKKKKSESTHNYTPTTPDTTDWSKAVGTYDFREDSEPNKVHFTYVLQNNGKVKYNLTNGPVGTYTISGNTIAMKGVWVETPERVLEMNVAITNPMNGNYKVLRGEVNGASVTSRRQ
jgi:hypothetical protein